MVGLQDQLQYLMERIDIIPDLVPKEKIFNKFADCMQWLHAKAKSENKN